MVQAVIPDLRLTITNPGGVASGVSSEFLFTRQGGSIGTAASDSWRLSNHRTGAVAGHAEIRFIDGDYCLIDRSGRTFINSASQPVGRGRRARLNSGDLIAIGRYRVRADLLVGGKGEELDPAVQSLTDDDLIQVPEGELRRPAASATAGGDDEPLAGLPATHVAPGSIDPMDGFNDEVAPETSAEQAAQRHLLADQPDWFADARPVSDEFRDNRDVAMGLPLQPERTDRMSQPDNTTAAQPSQEPSQQSRQHISGAPLLQGLDARLRFADTADMNQFLSEAGQALKATVDGLLALHGSEDHHHQVLRTRLQPIEDNPLRLGQDYDDTIQTLFATRRSPVHLSAPAAIRESLEGLHQHQQATQAAIAEALDAILHAFSPAALLKRFHGYRRSLQDGENESEWAWQMYQHYYRELSSSRQQGFERLFQEVFEQAYDQHLRQLQREKLS